MRYGLENDVALKSPQITDGYGEDARWLRTILAPLELDFQSLTQLSSSQ